MLVCDPDSRVARWATIARLTDEANRIRSRIGDLERNKLPVRPELHDQVRRLEAEVARLFAIDALAYPLSADGERVARAALEAADEALQQAPAQSVEVKAMLDEIAEAEALKRERTKAKRKAMREQLRTSARAHAIVDADS